MEHSKRGRHGELLYLLHDVAQVDVLHSEDIYWLNAGDTESQLLVPTI